MELKTTEEQARRYAKAILSDLRLYNEAKIEAGVSLIPELEQARALFVRRVAPDLHLIFDTEVVLAIPKSCRT